MKPATLFLCTALGLGQTALAEAPRRSPVPPARPGAVQPPLQTPQAAKPADPVGAFFKRLATAQPRQRPDRADGAAQAQTSQTSAIQSPTDRAATTSPRPAARPKGLLAALRSGAGDGSSVSAGATMKGAVCGVPTIKGKKINDIPGRIKGCGVSNPVKITSVAGVRLTMHPTIDCPTAQALDTWVKSGVIPAIGRRGGGLAEVKIVAHYACRTRNNQPGAKISEHGRGRAVDVAGFVLKNGETLTVLEDWRSGDASIMRAAHAKACGPFGTVLGPKSDRFHQDHFHVDTASYRGGPYCK